MEGRVIRRQYTNVARRRLLGRERETVFEQPLDNGDALEFLDIRQF